MNIATVWNRTDKVCKYWKRRTENPRSKLHAACKQRKYTRPHAVVEVVKFMEGYLSALRDCFKQSQDGRRVLLRKGNEYYDPRGRLEN